MNFLSIKIMEIVGYTIDLGGLITIIGLIYTFLQYYKNREKLKRESVWKIQMANKEIITYLKGPILNEAYPDSIEVKALIDSKSKEYNIPKKDLYNEKDIFNEMVKILYSQPNLADDKRKNMIKELRKRMFPQNQLLSNEKEREYKKAYIEFQEKIGVSENLEINKIPPSSEVKKKKNKKVIFEDKFELWEGWENYKAGIVVHSKDYHHSGNYCLKKDSKGDPYGGFKLFKEKVDFGKYNEIIFTGWIYRPSMTSPNLGDRLAIEDTDFNGYGFCINHSNNTICIERRDKAKPIIISPILRLDITPKDKWYHFEFHMKKEGKFTLLIFDEIGGLLVDLNSFIDNKHSSFSQVAIHGGFPYYVDDIKIEGITYTQ